MIIIAAAARTVDQQALDALLARYDSAGDRAEQEQIAEEIERLVGPAVRGMLASQLGGLGLNSEDLDALTTEAVQRALRESGLTRYHRQDIVPETLIQQMLTTEQGQKLMSLLPRSLAEQLVAVRYVKADLAQSLTDSLSELLTLADLPARLGQKPQEVTTSLVERTAVNAQLLYTLFPDAFAEVSQPQRSMLGYLKSTILREFKKRHLKERQPALNDTQRADWNVIRPYVEALRGELGRDPSSGEVYERYRGVLETRMKPARQWMEQQIARIQPNNPFNIKSPIDLKVARELLEAAGIDPTLWRDPGAPHYIAKRDVKPLGRQTVERLMQAPGLGAPSTPSAERVLPTVPAPATSPEAPSWAQGLGASDGTELYRRVLEHLYGQPQFGAERAVGDLLTRNSSPSIAELEQYLATLDPAIAEDIRQIGFENLAHEVDERVLEVLRDPQMRMMLAGHQGVRSAGFQQQVDAIRRRIFIRKSYKIKGLMRFGWKPQTLSSRRTRVIRSRISIASSSVRSSS